MNGFFIIECNYPQDTVFKRFNNTPKPVTIIILRFNFQRILNNINAPFFF